jgi:hypothetical protein
MSSIIYILYSLCYIELKLRTYVRGILPCMLRMSDSIGTHSIHGLTSGDLRQYFKGVGTYRGGGDPGGGY